MDKYDVVIVGGGPGGSAAAYYLASKGYDVIVIDKAKVPGQKNVTGGVLYGSFIKGYGLIDLMPNFEKEAPLERRVVDYRLVILSRVKGDRYKFLEVREDSLLGRVLHEDSNTGHDYTVLRAKLDRWFSSKVEEVGGILVTGTAVEDLIFDGGKVVGVRTHRGEEVYGDVVIDASGVTSKLVIRAGLRDNLKPDQVYYGLKQVYELDEETINNRFGVKPGEGVAMAIIGDFLRGMEGGAFLYTNRNTISVGLAVEMSSMLNSINQNIHEVGKPLDVLEDLLTHPYISRLLDGAKLVEYSAHLIPRGARVMLSKPYAPGFLVVGDALGTFTKINDLIDGMRRAIASGIMAAQAYEYAKKLGDFGDRGLSVYRELLAPIYRDIGRYRRNALLTENKLVYVYGYRIALKVLGREGRGTVAREYRDATQRIQERTGLLTYEEDKEYSHITVNYDAANKDPLKMWVTACPMNCYTLVVEGKGVFASFHDLYRYNLELLSRRLGKPKEVLIRDAVRETWNDVAKGQVRFDHVACVACGTCWVIGPPDVIVLNPERDGKGVKYRYG